MTFPRDAGEAKPASSRSLRLPPGSPTGARSLVARGNALRLLIAAAVCLVLWALGAWVAHAGPLPGERWVLVRLHEFAIDELWFRRLWRLVSNVGSPAGFQVVGVMLAAICGWRRLWPWMVAVMGATAMAQPAELFLKTVVRRRRPHWDDPIATPSSPLGYPSGHATCSMVGCGLLVLVASLVMSRAWQVVVTSVAVCVLAAVGFARVALGVHYPSDVLGGWLLGAALLLGWWAIAVLLPRLPRFGLYFSSAARRE